MDDQKHNLTSLAHVFSEKTICNLFDPVQAYTRFFMNGMCFKTRYVQYTLVGANCKLNKAKEMRSMLPVLLVTSG